MRVFPPFDFGSWGILQVRRYIWICDVFVSDFGNLMLETLNWSGRLFTDAMIRRELHTRQLTCSVIALRLLRLFSL